jgi:hypothetical protein
VMADACGCRPCAFCREMLGKANMNSQDGVRDKPQACRMMSKKRLDVNKGTRKKQAMRY